MAEKKESSGDMQERLYNIPLRGEWLRGPRIKRAGRSATAIRAFLSRHMKAGNVRISGKLNEELWARGLKRPPASIRIKARMDSDGSVTAMLPDEVIQKEEEKGKMEKLRERLGGGKEGKETEKAEEAKEGKSEEKKAEAPKEEKQEAPSEKSKEKEGPIKEGKPAESAKEGKKSGKVEKKPEKPKEDKS